MKLLLDQGLPRSTVAFLATLGIVAEHVGDLGMASASDESILDEGRRRAAVIVTLDADFHRLLAMTNAIAPSVIRIRIDGLKGEGLARLLSQVVTDAGQELAAGASVSVNEHQIRIRRLPLRS